MAESYVVIGGEGFVGHELVVALRNRYPAASVASFDIVERHAPSGWTFASVDMTDLAALTTAFKQANATCIFHTASPPATTSSKELLQKVNVQGTQTIVEACQAVGVRKLIYTSSGGVVTDLNDLINVDERLPFPEQFPDFYTSTKAEGERIVLEANGQRGLLTCAIRPSGIFGPGDRQMVPGVLQVLKNKQAHFQIGRNTNLFDWTYVDNVVLGHILAAEKIESSYPLQDLQQILPPLPRSVQRRDLPTSIHRVGDEWWDGERDVVYKVDQLSAADAASFNPPPVLKRNRFDQFYQYLHEPVDANEAEVREIPVAGQAFFITNGEPLPFFDVPKYLWYHYNGTVIPKPWVIPETLGLIVGTLAEFWSNLSGRPVGMNKSRVQYACSNRYFDIEKARRFLGYTPSVGLEEGLQRTVAWVKAEEAAGRSIEPKK